MYRSTYEQMYISGAALLRLSLIIKPVCTNVHIAFSNSLVLYRQLGISMYKRIYIQAYIGQAAEIEIESQIHSHMYKRT